MLVPLLIFAATASAISTFTSTVTILASECPAPAPSTLSPSAAPTTLIQTSTPASSSAVAAVPESSPVSALAPSEAAVSDPAPASASSAAAAAAAASPASLVASASAPSAVPTSSGLDVTQYGLGTWYGGDCGEQDCWNGAACQFVDYDLPPGIDGTTCVSLDIWDTSYQCGGCVSVTYKGATKIAMVCQTFFISRSTYVCLVFVFFFEVSPDLINLHQLDYEPDRRQWNASRHDPRHVLTARRQISRRNRYLLGACPMPDHFANPDPHARWCI